MIRNRPKPMKPIRVSAVVNAAGTLVDISLFLEAGACIIAREGERIVPVEIREVRKRRRKGSK